MLRHLLAFVSVASISALAACAAQPATGENGEEVGESKAAIHETACATDTTAHDFTTDGSIIGVCPGGFEGRHTSPDSTYGDSSCTHAFIVEYTDTIENTYEAVPEWAGSTLNSSNCSSAVLQIDTYDGSGTWTGTATGTGSWTGSTCGWSISGGSWPNISSGKKSRIVASAGFGSCSGKTCTYTSFVPVTVSILVPDC
jgi:hypothetical protein